MTPVDLRRRDGLAVRYNGLCHNVERVKAARVWKIEVHAGAAVAQPRARPKSGNGAMRIGINLASARFPTAAGARASARSPSPGQGRTDVLNHRHPTTRDTTPRAPTPDAESVISRIRANRRDVVFVLYLLVTGLGMTTDLGVPEG